MLPLVLEIVVVVQHSDFHSQKRKKNVAKNFENHICLYMYNAMLKAPSLRGLAWSDVCILSLLKIEEFVTHKLQ